MKKLLLMLLLGSGLSMVGQTKILLSAAGEKVPYTPLPVGTNDQYITGDHQLGDFTTAVSGATSVSTASSGNTMTVTVNSVASNPGGTIIHLVENAVSGTSLVTKVNGIAAQAIDLSGAISGGISNALTNTANTITSNVNGSIATAPAVTLVDSQITNNTQLTVSVNGVADATPLDLTTVINAIAPKQVVEEFTVAANGDTAFTLGTAARASTPVKTYVNGVKIKEDALTVTGGTAAAYVANENYSYALQAGDLVTIAYME